MSKVKRAMTAKAFRELLEAAGLSQVQAAALIGVDKQTVNRWATNKAPIDKFKAARIREVIQSQK